MIAKHSIQGGKETSFPNDNFSMLPSLVQHKKRSCAALTYAEVNKQMCHVDMGQLSTTSSTVVCVCVLLRLVYLSVSVS